MTCNNRHKMCKLERKEKKLMDQNDYPKIYLNDCLLRYNNP